MEHDPEYSQLELERSPSHWYRWFTILVGIVFGGGFLFLAVRRVDIAEVQQALRGAHLHWLLPLTLLQIGIFWMRGVRWAALFPLGHRPSSFRAFTAFLVNLLINNVLPGRIGEVLRIGVIKRHTPTMSLSGILATVVLERALDGIVLIGLLVVALLIAPLPAWVGKTGAMGGTLFLGLLILLFLITKHREPPASQLAGKSSGAIGMFSIKRLWHSMRLFLHQFAQGLSAMSDKRVLAGVLLQSLLIWGGEAVAIDLMFRVFGLNLPFSAALVTLVVLSLGLIIPSAPGFIGSYQFFIMSSLDIYKVPEAPALGVGVLFNLVIFVLSTLLGLLALFFEWPFVWSRRPNTRPSIPHPNTDPSTPAEHRQKEHG